MSGDELVALTDAYKAQVALLERRLEAAETLLAAEREFGRRCLLAIGELKKAEESSHNDYLRYGSAHAADTNHSYICDYRRDLLARVDDLLEPLAPSAPDDK